MNWNNSVDTDNWNLYSDRLATLDKTNNPIITIRKTIKIMDKFEFGTELYNFT